VRLAELLPQPIGAPASLTGPQQDDSLGDESSNPVTDGARTIADDARVKAFEILDERPRAVAIIERRLRAVRP